MERIITITTDFGIKDPYVGAMKGAILTINPGAEVVDISHLVSPQNILEGAMILEQAYSYFPKSTIHIGVIDPGVGGARRPILIETERYLFIGPDNGLFTPILTKEEIIGTIHITNKKYFHRGVSSTFHGRDVFAPVAAHLSLGEEPGSFGERIDDPLLLDIPEPALKEGTIEGEVILVDSFGNLITNIDAGDIPRLPVEGTIEVTIKEARIHGLSKTYGTGTKGRPIALIGSTNRLEIACNMGSASELLKAAAGERVEVRVLQP